MCTTVFIHVCVPTMSLLQLLHPPVHMQQQKGDEKSSLNLKGEKLHNKNSMLSFSLRAHNFNNYFNEDLHPFIDNFNHTQGRYKQGPSNRIQGNTKQTIPTTISCSTVVNKQGKHKLYGTPILSWHMGYFMTD